LRTGDVGYADEEGYFFMTDRAKRMINASGYKVWPAEVESVLYQHPHIKEACVIGVRDSYRGETVKAIVVRNVEGKDALTEEALIAWTRERMAAYKYPTSYRSRRSEKYSGVNCRKPRTRGRQHEHGTGGRAGN
jgi:fatty-acyl-CoA synthase